MIWPRSSYLTLFYLCVRDRDTERQCERHEGLFHNHLNHGYEFRVEYRNSVFHKHSVGPSAKNSHRRHDSKLEQKDSLSLQTVIDE